jgi:DNA (cytosine-5)-methyltransferase 1
MSYGRWPTTVDLFAGAGLLSGAFATEGFELIRAIELDSVAAVTYRKNLGNHIEVGNLASLRPSGRCDVLIAGPPCQGFSTLGKRDPKDQRNLLSLRVADWAKELKPQVVVIENVAAFIGSPIWVRLRRSLRRQGYKIQALTLNAYDFGVPQIRWRSFTIASKIDVSYPEPVVRCGGRTVRDAWEGLPPEPSGKRNHYAPTPSNVALERMKVIPPNGDRRDVMRIAPELAPASWWNLRCQVTDVWGRMAWDSPSNTLRTAFQNASKGRYIHPEQNRVISLREAARLHSIPDSWEFEGYPTQIARQIGNGVPPALGRAVARAVRNALS